MQTHNLDSERITFKNKYEQFKRKYERYFPATFFVGGFLFDIFTLQRIDDHITIIQQAIYLFVVALILFYSSLEQVGHLHIEGKIKKIWHYHSEIMHFLFGTLLSQFVFFYFLSSSFFTSFIFLIFLFGLMVFNELPQFRSQGPSLKFALFSLLLISYFACMIPMVVGFIGIIPLLISIFMCWGIMWLITYLFIRKGVPKNNTIKGVFAPAIAIGAVFLTLYIFKFLPPIPLSVQYIGIYQKIEKSSDQYILSYERDWWRFWQKGAQTFYAQPGDKVYCFVRIFSPVGIKDKVAFLWYKKNKKNNWELQDTIENNIVGGREHGFRGYAIKSNYEPGNWKVQVETLDGREIGRIYFSIYSVDAGPREFKVDKY